MIIKMNESEACKININNRFNGKLFDLFQCQKFVT